MAEISALGIDETQAQLELMSATNDMTAASFATVEAASATFGEECTLCIIHECDHLRGDVSGVEDDTQYQHLIETAWIEIYRTTPQLPERDLAYVKGILAYVPTEDAKAIIRLGWNEAAVKEAWMQYCTLAR